MKMKVLPAVGLAAGLCLLAAPSLAHPHVFVDVSLRFQDDGQGNLTGVEVTWVYDDFFSLLIVEDMQLDPDGDGVLTAAEEIRLLGFDLKEWPDGFEGDLYMQRGGRKIALDHPEPISATMSEGRIVARHHRSFGPVLADGLQVEPYDPTYYVAHSLTGDVVLPVGCSGHVAPPDLDAAQAQFRKLMAEVATEEDFNTIEIGGHYTDTLHVSCQD